jgi:predicted RNase H-like HicB family nuclease
MMFAVIYEVADDGSWHARAADLPVFSCADSREAVEKEIREGIAFHLEEDLREGKEMPLQTAHDAGMVDVEVPSVVAP